MGQKIGPVHTGGFQESEDTALIAPTSFSTRGGAPRQLRCAIERRTLAE
jgi:hypothetical protein